MTCESPSSQRMSPSTPAENTAFSRTCFLSISYVPHGLAPCQGDRRGCAAAWSALPRSFKPVTMGHAGTEAGAVLLAALDVPPPFCIFPWTFPVYPHSIMS